jgi:hypothetical protein
MINTEHLARATESCLDFVRDEECTMFTGHLPYCWPIVIRRDDRTCFSLDWFDDDSCDADSELLTGLELRAHSICIPIFDKIYWSTIEFAYALTIECLPHHRE